MMEMVTAYYLGRPDGKVEKYQMHRIDLDEALRDHPEQWATVKPPGVEAIQKYNDPLVIEKTKAVALPMVERPRTVLTIRNPGPWLGGRRVEAEE